jgi:small ligand-binding sensory domain FIST
LQFASAVSRREKTHEAAQQIILSLQQQLSGSIDLLTVFFTPDHRDEAALIGARLRRELSPRLLIGCMGEGVIGGEREIEDDPGITALAGRMPGVTLSPFHIASEEWEEVLDETKEHRLHRRLGIASSILDDTRAFMVLGDPYTTPITEFMERLETCAPGVPIVGGMASGGNRPGQNALLLHDDVWDEGAVGVRIAGPVRVVTVVSQGCRPVGETMLVTKAVGRKPCRHGA